MGLTCASELISMSRCGPCVVSDSDWQLRTPDQARLCWRFCSSAPDLSSEVMLKTLTCENVAAREAQVARRTA